jgi:hypothetical protein
VNVRQGKSFFYSFLWFKPKILFVNQIIYANTINFDENCGKVLHFLILNRIRILSHQFLKFPEISTGQGYQLFKFKIKDILMGLGKRQ